MTDVRLPLGEGTITVSVPGDVTIAEPPTVESVDPRAAVERAMADPHGPPLADLVSDNDDVAIVVTDVTRDTPDRETLAALFDRLPIPSTERGERVTIVLGLGLHRPMTDAEIEAALGEYAPLAVNHDPDDTVTVGHVDGVAVELSRTVAAADVTLATGLVEPHQYAGFSGGAKTVVIGAGGEPLVRYTHGPSVLSKPGVRLGSVDDNPFREILDRAGDLAGPDYAVNLAAAPSGFLGAAAGRPRAVVRELARRTRQAVSVPVAREYDACLAGVGAPKDANLYQTSRAATYVALGARDPVPDGRIVVPARLTEGAGEGRGERRFADRLANAESAESLYESMRAGYEPGAQRAFVLARTLRDHDVWITNSDCPELVEESLLHAADTPADALDAAADVLVVPDALDTLLVPPAAHSS